MYSAKVHSLERLLRLTRIAIRTVVVRREKVCVCAHQHTHTHNDENDGRQCEKTWEISLLLHRHQHNHGDFARGLAPIVIKGRHHLNHLVV